MATIGLARGKTETVLSLTTPGLAANDYRIPQDIQGARMSWQTTVTGASANNVSLEVSLDGVNYMANFDVSTTTSTEVRVVPVEGIMAVRARWNSTTGGTAATVFFRCA